ncbi:MAG TPA: hypothetical protein VFV34_18535 [Blastocatellia bacterium]|nr:hypothetical protein [Blastocatellia bacterium]
MKSVYGFLLSLTILATVSVDSLAGQRWIDRREHQQQQRIREGIRGDELTRREAARLEAEQARIRVYERYARSDGHLSANERRRLDRQLDRASRQIYRQKHDRQEQ